MSQKTYDRTLRFVAWAAPVGFLIAIAVNFV